MTMKDCTVTTIAQNHLVCHIVSLSIDPTIKVYYLLLLENLVNNAFASIVTRNLIFFADGSIAFLKL